MKQFVTKSIGLAIGVALVTPLLMAPTAVNGSLGGFSANAQGGQNPGDWGIPKNASGQNSGGQNSGGQNGAGQGKGPDAGGYGSNGNGQNPQNGGGQNAAGQGKGPDAGGYGSEGNGQNSQSGGQRGPGENSASGQGEHYNDGPTKNNSNNPDGEGSAEGEGPTKNNSNNPDGDGAHGNGNGSGSGSGNGGDFPPLDPSSDGQYDPADNGGDQQIPSGCAEAGSVCAQCVQHNENIVQFNRRYLHVAWSTTHQTLDYTKQAIAFGDGVSQMSNTSLSWQLAGKPQIIEAVQSLRKTYDAKYRIYINNMEQALNAMNQCEQDNFAVRDLYQRFSSLYLEFVKARYQSPD